MDLLNENSSLDNKTIDRLKYDLVRDGLVTYDDIEHASELAIAQNTNIGQVLINTQMISEDILMRFLEEKLHTPSVDLENYIIDKRCLEFITFQDAIRFKILPLFLIEDTLTVAMADPMDLFSIDKIMQITKKNIDPVIASEKSIIKKINEYYDIKAKVEDINLDNSKNYNWQEELHSDNPSNEHMQVLFRAILKQAISEHVHELYFETNDEGLSVNFKKPDKITQNGVIPSLLTSSFTRPPAGAGDALRDRRERLLGSSLPGFRGRVGPQPADLPRWRARSGPPASGAFHGSRCHSLRDGRAAPAAPH